MTIICGPSTITISYVSQNICGHLVKVSDIKPIFPDIIEVQVGNQIIPGVGYVSVSLAPDFTRRATINLISKNVGAGTATISFAIETIEIPPPPIEVATHYLDIYLKPYSWYTPGGAADSIATKLGDINGTILNLFSSVGISDYQYIGTEVLTEADKPDTVTIRIKLKQLSIMSMAIVVPLAAYIAAIVVALLVIVIIIGVITGWKFTLAGFIAQITGKTFTTDEVIEIVDKVKDEQLDECNKNYSGPNTASGCQKSVICGAANGLTDALKITGANCTDLNINQKVDSCLAQYNIDGDKTKYDACIRGISKDATVEIKKKAPKEADLTTLLMYGGFFLAGLYLITKGNARVTTPTLVKRERLRPDTIIIRGGK